MLSLYDMRALYMLNTLHIYHNAKRSWIYRSSSDRRVLSSLINEGLIESDTMLSLSALGCTAIAHIRSTLPKDELNTLDRDTMAFYEQCLERVRKASEEITRRRKNDK